jgi:hypothetical protein
MKTYHLVSAQAVRLAGLTQVVFFLLIWPLANACFGAAQTNVVGWSDNFENYTNQTPLIAGTNGWYASSADCVVTSGVGRGSSQAAMLPVDVTLSNRFVNAYTRLVTIEMYARPQLYDGTNYPDILGTNNNTIVSTNVAAQFFINSNGYFVVGNGTNWNEATTMANGNRAISITNDISNALYTRIHVNLRYKNHTWSLKAWTNGVYLVASTPYVNFTSNINNFSGFDVYNGNSTSYLDEVSVVTGRQSKVNGVPFDTVKSMNGARPGFINGVSE